MRMYNVYEYTFFTRHRNLVNVE